MIHPSGIQTSDFEIFHPTRAQVEQAARRAKDRFVRKQRFRDRHPLLAELLFAIIFLVIVVLGFSAAVIIREAVVGGL